MSERLIEYKDDPENLVHARRLDHARCAMVLELMALGDPRVDKILRRYEVKIIDGPRLSMEYPFDDVPGCIVMHRIPHPKEKK